MRSVIRYSVNVLNYAFSQKQCFAHARHARLCHVTGLTMITMYNE